MREVSSYFNSVFLATHERGIGVLILEFFFRSHGKCDNLPCYEVVGCGFFN